jgi:outer membrane protein assembly factor BamB
MHNLIYKSEEAKIVDFYQNDIIIQKANQIVFLERLSSAFESIWKFKIERKGADYLKTDNQELSIYDKNESLIINKDSGDLVLKEKRYFFKRDKDVSVYMDLDNEDFIQINYKGKEFSIENINSNRYFSENYMIEVPYRTKLIRCYNLETGKELWIHNFSDLISSEKELSLFGEVVFYKEKLFFFLSDVDKAAGTFVANVETGKLIHKTKTFGGSLKRFGNKIMTTSDDSLYVLDLDTYEEEVVGFSEVLKENELKISWNIFSVSGTYLYFSDVRKPIVGGLDTITKELLWKYEFSNDTNKDLKIIAIDLFNNKVSVRTNDNSMFLYERV